MDLWQALRIIVRRFYIFVPVLLLALVLAVNASGRIAPEYTAEAAAILIARTPIPGTAPTAPNAWSNLPSTARAIQLTVENSATRSKVRDEGLSTDYLISVQNRSEIMEVEATSKSADTARETAARVLTLIGADLKDKQDSTDPPTPQNVRIDLKGLADPTVPGPNDSGAKRVRILILALGLLAAAAAAFLFDGAAQTLKRRRAASEAAAARVEAEAPAAPEQSTERVDGRTKPATWSDSATDLASSTTSTGSTESQVTH